MLPADLPSIVGYFAAYKNTTSFVADQYPSSLPADVLLTPNAQILAYQIGNLYGLMAILGLAILNITDDPRIVKAYILCLAIGDIGHVAPTIWVLGWDRAVDFQNFNYMAWGNLGGTAFLFVVRLAYLMGLFGKSGEMKRSKMA